MGLGSVELAHPIKSDAASLDEGLSRVHMGRVEGERVLPIGLGFLEAAELMKSEATVVEGVGEFRFKGDGRVRGLKRFVEASQGAQRLAKAHMS